MYMNVDTLIVGGGISGLYLNYLLLHKNTCLIEKSSYFGGRVETFTTKFRNKKYSMEAGAGRFTNNHKRLIKLIKKFGLTNKMFELSKKVNLFGFKNSDLGHFNLANIEVLIKKDLLQKNLIKPLYLS